MSTDVQQFLDDMDGGVFSEKLSALLSEVGSAVVDTGKNGKITIELTMKQIASSHQVHIDHVLKYDRPTTTGNASGKRKTATPYFVGRGGALTFYPEQQGKMFDKSGQPQSGDAAFKNGDTVDPVTGEVIKRDR